MDSKEYLKFCYDNYREEFKERDRLIPRQGFLLTGIVVLGGLVAKLSCLNRLSVVLGRIDVFFYYLAILGALISLATAVFYLARSVCPRLYEQLESPVEFDKWRAEIEKLLRESPEGMADSAIEEIVATRTNRALVELMNAATDRNATENLAKITYLNKTIYAVVTAVGFLAIEMLAALVYSLVSLSGA